VEGAAPGHTLSGTLGSRAIATITAAGRTMYPHDALSDNVSARAPSCPVLDDELLPRRAAFRPQPALRRLASPARGRC